MIVQPGPDVERRELLAVAFHDYPLDDALVACVVPVGSPAAAAVISYENALCSLHVDEHGAAIREHHLDVVPAIASGELAPVHPAMPGRACTYLQSRRMVRYDLDQRVTKQLRMVRGDDSLIAGTWLSGQENRLAVQVEDTSRYDDGGLVLGRVEVFDLATDRRLGAAPLPRARDAGQGWAAGADAVAIARDGGLVVFDAAMQPLADHPLARAARTALADAGASEVHALRIHPSQPLAVLAACTADVMGVRDFTLHRVGWGATGEPEVRRLAKLHAVGDVGFGAFAPAGDALDIRVATGGVTWMMLAVGPRLLLDLGPSRGLQGAVWSGPRRFLAFERGTAQIVAWNLPEGTA
ncbi:hypothetical protein SAMN02745121_02058 [Nannocystis exedens]|uniref:Uncharacterized protein n=1 Tax=Nannocystis exedens TaxID=54 RepID=A0A1I1W3Y1_9BACT|nr:hypothetical protein [Nannocystis exedens]PCC72940.1 hypothetical protein NAEX_06026 [Nannocystis exedens]SFD87680.1 hypothetical protein SAMN02745121_02058 [Nannocystis exedens]